MRAENEAGMGIQKGGRKKSTTGDVTAIFETGPERRDDAKNAGRQRPSGVFLVLLLNGGNKKTLGDPDGGFAKGIGVR